MRIAVVEDEPVLASTLAAMLAEARHESIICHQGHRFLALLRKETCDLILLDWNLPDMSGLAVIEALKRTYDRYPPVLVYSGRSDERDMVTALRAGADDFVTKPATTDVLLARIESLARRAYPAARQDALLSFGSFVFDQRLETVCRNGQPVELTPKEYALALLLFQKMPRSLSRAYLIDSVWGQARGLESRTLDSHISRIRVKLGLEASNGFRLVTLYGQGYRLVATTV